MGSSNAILNTQIFTTIPQYSINPISGQQQMNPEWIQFYRNLSNSVSNVAATDLISTDGANNTFKLDTAADSGISITVTSDEVLLSNTGVVTATGTANQINTSAASGEVTISLATNVILPAPSSGVTLSIGGAPNTYALDIAGDAVTGESFGVKITSGTNASDIALLVQNSTSTNTVLKLSGDGSGLLGGSSNSNPFVTWNSAGAVNLNAAASGSTLTVAGEITVNASANTEGVIINGSTTTSESFGLFIKAGTNNSDNALQITDVTNTRSFLAIRGNAEVFFGNAGDNPNYTFNGTGAVLASAMTLTPAGSPTSGATLLVNGFANKDTALFQGSSTTGESFGLTILAGTNNSDNALQVTDVTNTRSFLAVRGNGEIFFGNTGDNPSYTFNGTGTVSMGGLNVSGTATIATLSIPAGFVTTTLTLTPTSAPSAATLVVNGFANKNTAAFIANNTASEAFGVFIQAGTNNSDTALQVTDVTNTRSFLDIRGNAEIFFGNTGDNPTYTFNGTGVVSMGGLTVAGTATINTQLIANGVASTWTAEILGSATSNASYGLLIEAGTSSSDYALYVANHGNSAQYLLIDGAGNITTSNASLITLDNSLGVVIGAPSSTPTNGCSLLINGTANKDTLILKGSSTTGQSYGLFIQAGSNSSDVPIQITDTTNTRSYFAINGAGAGSFSNAGDKASFFFAGSIGVNGATPPGKPTVTGSKAGNAALASLLSALASYGLVTDSST